ncbi:hypothetical protein BGZ49_005752 [Haplosporangium sp. Z 27]|nr:hypothetical protein BGZ49_005752 [Haplosporangium sp. Z 27]
MTTSSISEPKTENTQSIEPLMDRRASSPRLDASSPTTPSIFTFPALSLINDRSALADPHKRDIIKSVEAKRVDDSLTSLGDETATEQDSTSMTIRSSLDSTPTSLPSTSTSIAVSTQENSEAPSIEQQNSTSYVLNGMHNCHKVTSNRSRRASHRQQHQQETDVREMDISVLEGYDAEDNEPNAITTPTSISPTASSSFEHSVIANVDVDMSMTSPIRNTKSPPTSTSSSMSTGRRKIAESSMILSAGTLPAARSITAGGSLSPAWSMTSIPRDISASYNQSHQERELPLSDPADEKLYSLVDRYGFLVEEGRTPIVDRNSTHEYPPSSSQRSVRSANGSRSDIIAKRSANFEPNIRQIYHNMLNISSPEEEQIDLDIPRTMHGHIMFRTRYGPGGSHATQIFQLPDYK